MRLCSSLRILQQLWQVCVFAMEIVTVGDAAVMQTVMTEYDQNVITKWTIGKRISLGYSLPAKNLHDVIYIFNIGGIENEV